MSTRVHVMVLSYRIDMSYKGTWLGHGWDMVQDMVI